MSLESKAKTAQRITFENHQSVIRSDSKFVPLEEYEVLWKLASEREAKIVAINKILAEYPKVLDLTCTEMMLVKRLRDISTDENNLTEKKTNV